MEEESKRNINIPFLVIIVILTSIVIFLAYTTYTNQIKIDQLTETVNSNSELQTQLDQKTTDYNNIKAELDKLKEDFDKLNTDFTTLKTESDSLRTQNADLQSRLDDMTNKYNNLLNQTSNLPNNNSNSGNVGNASSGTVYLTFDDGPSANTDQVLNVLNQYGIKGTFFVTGNGDASYFNRIVNEGHTLALHTFTHDYNSIYASSDAFFQDLYAIRDKIYNQVGLSPHIFRFAGGSSNSYLTPSILSQIITRSLNEGFVYFDWNCSNGDTAASVVDTNTLISNATSCALTDTIIILMHDAPAKTTTPTALPYIIEYYQNQGYQFKSIDDSTPLIQHRTN